MAFIIVFPMLTFRKNTHLHNWRMSTSHTKSKKVTHEKKSCLVLLVTIQYSIIKTPNR